MPEFKFGNRQMRRHSPMAAMFNKPQDLVELEKAKERFATEYNAFSTQLQTAPTPSTDSRVPNFIQKILMPWREIKMHAPMLYRGDPVAISATEAAKAFSDTLNHVVTRYPASKYPQYRLDGMKELDIYSTEIGGTSLKDIENFSTPLERNEIRGINRFLKKIVGVNQLRAQVLFLFMPTQVLVQGDGKPSASQAGLFRSATSYYDYYLPFLTEPHLPWNQEQAFHRTAMWLTPFFKTGIGAYLPARMGLTPSSVEKRLTQKEITSWIGNRVGWKGLNQLIIPEVREAYRANGLPQKLEKYQHLDKIIDEKAANLLSNYYYPDSSKRPPVNPISIKERFGRYKKALTRDISRSTERSLTWQLDHPLVTEVIVASQNSDTIILVLQFKDRGNFLTLELNKNNELFGLPPSLAKDYPHLEDHLTDDIIGSLLGQLKSSYPDVEPTYKPRPRIEIKPRPEAPLKELRITEVELDEEPALPRGLRWLRKPTPVVQEPELPTTDPEVTRHKYTGNYTRATIIEQIGRKHRPEDVDRIIRTLQRFERGEKSIKALYEDEAYSLRVGDWRIIIEFGNEQDFDIRRIAWRDIVYK